MEKSPTQKLWTVVSIRDLELRKKRVFLRLDLNVPLSDPDTNGQRTVTDTTRIDEALPTIRFAMEQGARVVLASHLGRPNGQRKETESLAPVADVLAERLGVEVMLTDDCIGEGIEMMTQSLKQGQVLLLENLRFHGGEEANDPKFCKALSRLADVYIMDAFGTAHRKHASVYGLPQIMNKKGVGLLVERELKYLDPLLHSPQKPFVTILGGSKVSDKIKTIEALLPRVDTLLIGGAMAYAFMAAKGQVIPKEAKTPYEEEIQAAKRILRAAEGLERTVLLPIDTCESYDIGPKTIGIFQDALRTAKTVFWNGPVGWFEKPPYEAGTRALAEYLSSLSALKVVGGGDTVSAIKTLGYAEGFDHLSTGGGAVLKYLEGKGLPGIDVLKVDLKRRESSALEFEDLPESEGDSQ